MQSPRRVVLYARVSKANRADQGGSKSVEQQLTALRDLATREAVTVVNEHRDDSISASRYAKNKARDGWKATMDDVAGGRVDELWVWELSRASRDREVWAALLGACMERNVKIVVNGRVHDPNDDDDAFMLDLGAAFTVKESARASARIRRDVASRAAQGLPHGKVPYGYRRIYDPHTGALLRQEPDPETAPIVRELVRRVLGGEALYRVAAEMNARGVPSPETVRRRRAGDTATDYAWRPDQVRDVAASPAAAGLRVHRGVVLEGVDAAWEPIVERADYYQLVAKFADPSRRSWVDASARHLLTGLARCGKCGGEIRRIKNRGTPSYACVGKRHGHDGSKRFCVARKILTVDDYVEEVIVARLTRPDLLAVLAAAGTADDTGVLEQLHRLRAEHSELIALAERREISVVAFARLEAVLTPQIAAAERLLADAEIPPVVAETAGADAEQRWSGLALEQKRQIIRTLADVRLHPVGRGVRTFQPESVEVAWH